LSRKVLDIKGKTYNFAQSFTSFTIYKIKDHTAIVCLDQLQRYKLTLDKGVSKEIMIIPGKYMDDVETPRGDFSLRRKHRLFGEGLSP